MLQRDPELRARGSSAEYQRALAAGDVDAILATFEPDAYAREPAGAEYIHRGVDGLRAFYARLFSNSGGIPLEHCALVGTGRLCALEYNIVQVGRGGALPGGGRRRLRSGESGMLSAARIYDDADPPIRTGPS